MGQCCETTAVLVSATEPAIAPLVEMIRVSVILCKKINYIATPLISLQRIREGLESIENFHCGPYTLPSHLLKPMSIITSPPCFYRKILLIFFCNPSLTNKTDK